MATGKTNQKYCRLLIDQVDASGFTRQVGSVGVTYDTKDVSAYSDAVTNFTLGHPTFVLDGYQAVLDNTALGEHAELSAVEEYITTFAIGIRAAPALGDPAILSVLEQTSYVIDGDAVNVTAGFARGQTNIGYKKSFGLVLEPGAASRSETLTGTSVQDVVAATSNGAIAHLHVTVSSGTTWTLKVQDAPDDSTWADLITFSADGSVIVGEQATVAGNVDKWLRVLLTRVGGAGSLTAWVAIARQ